MPNYIDPMVANEATHDIVAKTLLGGAVLPARQTAAMDLNGAIDNIFNDSNVGPFIGKQLIQHLVTSNPSPAYVARVAAAFNGETNGVRGDMKTVIKAILLDPEARGDVKTDANYGHLRHPALFISALLRAFRDAYGMPPHTWLTDARVRRARLLLDAGTAPAEAAVAVGFTDQPHLNRHFARIVGVPPGAYQRERKNVQDARDARP